MAAGRACEQSMSDTNPDKPTLRDQPRGWWLDYALAVAALAVATAVRFALDLGDVYPFVTYFGAVTVVAWFASTPPAIFTLVLGSVLAFFMFVSPRDASAPTYPPVLLGMALSVAVSAIVIAMSHAMRVARTRAERLLADALLRRESLAASEARFRELAEAMPQIVYESDAEGRVVFANRQWLDYTGQSDAQTASLGPVVHPDDLGDMVRLWEAAKTSGTPLQAEFRLRRAVDGEYRWFLTRSVPIRDGHDRVVKWFGTSTDIHDQKQVEQRLAESEARYRAIGESIDFGVWVCDAAGRNTYASESFLRMVGITQQQCSDFGWGDVLHPDDAAATMAAWKECVRTQGSWDRQHRFRGVDGQWRHLLARGAPLRDAAGEVLGWAGINLDITRLVHTEQDVVRLAAESDRQRRLYETVLTNTPDFVYVFSLDHRVLYANDALIKMWGRGHDGAIGKTFLEIGYEPWHAEMHDREIDQVRATRQPIRGEVPFTGTHGRRQYDYIFVPVIGADGEVEAVAGTTRDVTERKQTEDQLRRNHDTFFALIQNNPFGVYAVDADFRLRQVSLGAQKVFETVRPLLGRDFAEVLRILWPEPFASEAIARFRHTLDTGEPYSAPSTLERRADIGEVEAYDWRIERISLPDGRYGVVCYFYDLSERQRWEATLRDSEERLRMALAAARMVAWEWTPADGKLRVSENAADVFGLPAGVGLTGIDQGLALMHPEDVTAYRATFQRAIADRTGYLTLYRVVRPDDGRTIWIEERGHTVFDQPGGGVRLYGVAVDVTARHQAEERLRLSEERFRTLFDTIDEGFCVIEMEFDVSGRPIDYRVEVMNPAFEKHTGMHGLVGQSVRQAIPNLEEFWFEAYGRVASTGQPARFIHEAQPMGRRWFDVSAVRLGGHGSHKVAILFNDITDRKLAEAERELLVSQLRDQDRRKDEFLATLAHELRNPLAPIRVGLELMRMAGPDVTVERTRSMMERQVGQLIRLVDDLLDVSRVTSGKLLLRKERVELRAVIDAAVETSRPAIEQAGHHISVVVPEEPIVVDGDPIRLAQVVSNLLSNSARYTHQGGHIRVSASRDDAVAVLTVADDGIGIPTAMLDAVFGMFTQVDRTLEKATGGLGIGLSLVKGLVEMHGGTIEACSEGEGRGSQFVVRLPVAPPMIGELEPTIDQAIGVGPSGVRRVLVVDDNVDAADSLAELLEMLGTEVRAVYDGEAGIEGAKMFRPDVVLCDIGMPKVNGYNVARRIRAEEWGRNVVLVALTGWGQTDDRKKSADAGFDHHLVKPVEDTALRRLLAGL